MATDNGKRAAMAMIVIAKWRALADAARAAGQHELAAQAEAHAASREADMAKAE